MKANTQSYDGQFVRAANRRPSSDDIYTGPQTFRRVNGASGIHQVQLLNGLHHQVGTGRRFGYAGEGYMYAIAPVIPGQYNAQNKGGFVPKGPDPLSMARLFRNGPGSQPVNPGGPGKMAGTQFVNPMTG